MLHCTKKNIIEHRFIVIFMETSHFYYPHHIESLTFISMKTSPVYTLFHCTTYENLIECCLIVISIEQAIFMLHRM